MLRTIIIDDEPLAVSNLKNMLTQFCPQVSVLSTWTDSTHGLWEIRKQKPDLLFLDVMMPQQDGFDVLDAVADLQLPVIFVTAHDQFARRAFRYSAVDYLLKPFEGKDLIQAVAKVEKRQSTTAFQIDHLRQQLHHPNRPPDTILLPYQNGDIFVALNDILYCAADDNATYFHVSNGQRYLKNKNLKYVEELLEERDFIRVHKSYLVNIHQVKKLVRGENSMMHMANNESIPVSRSYRDRIVKHFGWL